MTDLELEDIKTRWEKFKVPIKDTDTEVSKKWKEDYSLSIDAWVNSWQLVFKLYDNKLNYNEIIRNTESVSDNIS